VIGVGAVVFDDLGRVLLIRRGKPPLLDRYVLPGGTLEWGESIDEGTRREILEETGIEIEIEGRLPIIEALPRDRAAAAGHHFVIVDAVARRIGGDLRAGSDAREALFAAPEDFARYRLPSAVADAIEAAGAFRRGRRRSTPGASDPDS
jgi:ADP-ribose pyrophosphatase YjhB (NUDIX family)